MTLLPEQHSFTLWRGATFATRCTLYTDSAGTTLRDLTGYTSELVIKDRIGNILMTLTNGAGITLGDDEGTIDIFISDDDTAAIDWNYGIYTLSITSIASNTDVLLWGAFKIRGT